MEMIGQPHIPAVLPPTPPPSPRRATGTHLIGRSGDPRAGMDYWRRERSLAVAGIWNPDRAARLRYGGSLVNNDAASVV
jgi:hypothetical protein